LRKLKRISEYHQETSYDRKRMGGHYLDWQNQPLVFKTYPNMEPLILPSDVELPEKNLSSILQIEADGPYMNSIFSNLILNAKDALDEIETDRPKEIGMTVGKKDDGAGSFFVIAVADNGPGISEEHLSEIFEPFFSTKPTTGTGLGLGVVKRLVQLYKGKIEVESETGKGTTFTVTLTEN